MIRHSLPPGALALVLFPLLMSCSSALDDDGTEHPTSAPSPAVTGEPTSAASETPAAGSSPEPSSSPGVTETPLFHAGSTPTLPAELASPSPHQETPPAVTPTPGPGSLPPATATPSVAATTGTPPPATPPPATPPPDTPSPDPTTSVVVDTVQGEVRGFPDEMDTVAWLGIPFASPPVGPLRWRPPAEPGSRSEPLEASHFPSPCPQFEQRDDDGDGEKELYPIGNEDCLYLNAWHPGVSREVLPIMVWIHGGSNTTGATDNPLYHGARLAARANVLLFTIQYRLNLFGFLYHEALFNGDPANDSGNYATLDIIRALEWIRDNGEAFGGDPTRVTVFGESAGGVNTWSMLMSPLADGLFHRVIVESGCFSSRTTEEARAHAEELIEIMVVAEGLTSEEDAAAWLEAQGTAWIADYLYGKSEEDIMTLFVEAGGFPTTPFKPTRDGFVFSDGAEQDLIDGRFHHVPTIIGANRDEEKLFYADLANMSELEYNVYMRALFGDDVPLIEALYPRDAYDPPTPYNQFTDILDLVFEPLCSEYMSWLISPYQPTWLYHFRYDNLVPPYDYIFGAAHGFELPFVFDHDDGALYKEDDADTRDQLAGTFAAYWGCMARFGNPNCDAPATSVPEWQQISQENREAFRRIVLDDTVEMEVLPDINLERMNFWLDYYGMPYPAVPEGGGQPSP